MHRWLSISVVLCALASLILTGCPAPDSAVTAPRLGVDWPSFRGIDARGDGGDVPLPESWDLASGTNVLFRVPIPGLAHASPVVWEDRIFIATAVSEKDDVGFKHGLYGSGDAAEDRWEHAWHLIALNKRDGSTLWDAEVHRGTPTDKRHIKATYANSTPVTDGKIVVALFGSEGLFAYDIDGNRLWQADLGRLDVGAYDAPDYEWGSASSPIIDGDRVIVQCDTQGTSFIAAYSTTDGRLLWRTERDALPSWGTPTIVETEAGQELVTNGSPSVIGYNPEDGTELWRLGGSSNITAPTPFEADGLIVVASGRRPEAPIFAIRAGSRGDITPAEDGRSEHLAWSLYARGPYMPTPIAYDGILYSLNNNGVLDAYRMATGEEIYRERIPHVGGGFSASPVLGGGLLYLPGEDGDVFIVRPGEAFELVATLPVDDLLMATPAISEGVLYIRGERYLLALGLN
ncbi:MAG: PQQ-like beta-propeller repeat protein [Acidobacteriota bacterium]|nr:PQQ-like beta-propeller repeat protein [Acidobacteriota bacterium]